MTPSLPGFMESSMPGKEEFLERQERVRALMDAADVDTLVVGHGPDLRYLCGISGAESDRMTALVVRAGSSPALIAPTIEADSVLLQANKAGISEIRTWSDDVGPLAVLKAVAGAAESLLVNPNLSARSLLQLQKVLQPKSVGTSESITGVARRIKSPWEVEQLSHAAKSIMRVHEQVPTLIREGISESQIAHELTTMMLEAGHLSAEFVIVAVGANAAEPHHVPNDTLVEVGEPIVVDIGGPIASGYFSDMTRMYCLGEPKPEQLRVFTWVKDAQEITCREIRCGMTTTEVDALARDYLVEHGVGEYFTHRLGHGIGLEVHEQPTLGGKDVVKIEDGMVFSVEPGVYVSGEYGLRTEDIVVMSEGRAKRLNITSHEMLIL